MTLRPEVIRGSLLWQPLSGRSAPISEEALASLAPGTPLWGRLARLQMVGEVDWGALLAVRSRLALWIPARSALWCPDPARPGAGGYAWREIPLDLEEAELWRRIRNPRRLAQLSVEVGIPLERALQWCRKLADPGVQALQLRESPPHLRDPSLERVVSPPRPLGTRDDRQRGTRGETTLGAYHRDLSDVSHHFDERETTVAHALAPPHPALEGLAYGARLRQRLALAGVPTDVGVVEVGGGTGELARDWLAAGGGPYTRIDLSPSLLALQAQNAPRSAGILGDAVALPLREGSVALLLSNEVLADLPAHPWTPGDDGEVSLWIERFDLSRAAGWKNLGGWKLVAEVARVLRPGGCAWLSEFGDPEEEPQETEQLDHPEVSIHFGDLVKVAEGLGLRAELRRLDDALGMQAAATWVARPVWEGARAWAAREGVSLEARAWSAVELERRLGIEGLWDVSVREPGPGPLPSRFYAVLLRK